METALLQSLDPEIDSKSVRRSLPFFRGAGWGLLVGLVCGAVIGGLTGTAIFPLFGTAYGALIGAIVGVVVGLICGTVIGSIAFFASAAKDAWRSSTWFVLGLLATLEVAQVALDAFYDFSWSLLISVVAIAPSFIGIAVFALWASDQVLSQIYRSVDFDRDLDHWSRPSFKRALLIGFLSAASLAAMGWGSLAIYSVFFQDSY